MSEAATTTTHAKRQHQRPVLVANRGEVACRILRGLRALGRRSVAVYTPPDAHALHPTLADASVALADAGDYLRADVLIAAAKAAGAGGVHPGYGFLSQDPAFAAACVAAGLVFIGPSAACMAEVGDKRAARRLATSVGVPVVPGDEAVHDAAGVLRAGERFGYPLLVKAAAAGGGRGLRRVAGPDEVSAAVVAAAREARGSAGDGALFVERWLTDVRHVEVQVLGDGKTAVAVGDRDCSLQRRLQKVVEEAPAPRLSAATRAALHDAAERVLQAAGYSGAGTVEFLVTQDGAHYFLEINPRLQVEHPVTELIGQLDIVQLQLQLALEEFDLSDFVRPTPYGHAIEVRLNAEDPAEGFVPSTGLLTAVRWPQGPGVRVDAGVDTGSLVTPHYDALLAKLIAWGPTREVARQRLLQALRETVVMGVRHNGALLQALLATDAFVEARATTATLEASPTPTPARPPRAVLEAVARAWAADAQATPAATSTAHEVAQPWSARDGWRLGCAG